MINGKGKTKNLGQQPLLSLHLQSNGHPGEGNRKKQSESESIKYESRKEKGVAVDRGRKEGRMERIGTNMSSSPCVLSIVDAQRFLLPAMFLVNNKSLAAGLSLDKQAVVVVLVRQPTEELDQESMSMPIGGEVESKEEKE